MARGSVVFIATFLALEARYNDPGRSAKVTVRP
jgi:hypothetical protein